MGAGRAPHAFNIYQYVHDLISTRMKHIYILTNYDTEGRGEAGTKVQERMPLSTRGGVVPEGLMHFSTYGTKIPGGGVFSHVF